MHDRTLCLLILSLALLQGCTPSAAPAPPASTPPPAAADPLVFDTWVPGSCSPNGQPQGQCPPGELFRVRLVPVAALRLVVLEHDAGTHLDALREGRRRPPVRRRRSRVVVYRRNYAVFRREQTAAAFALLEELVKGLTVGQALARAVGSRGARLGADEAFRLFRDWAAMGLFRAVEPEPSPRRASRARVSAAR